MEIKIKDGEEFMILTDEGYDNDNFVCIIIDGKEFDAPLDELLSAVHAFEQKRIMRITREKYKTIKTT